MPSFDHDMEKEETDKGSSLEGAHKEIYLLFNSKEDLQGNKGWVISRLFLTTSFFWWNFEKEVLNFHLKRKVYLRWSI